MIMCVRAGIKALLYFGLYKKISWKFIKKNNVCFLELNYYLPKLSSSTVTRCYCYACYFSPLAARYFFK